MGNFDPARLDEAQLRQNLLLEASAGTGKTYALERVVVQLLRGRIPLRQLLVLTFTKKAAADLSLRIYQHLSHCCEKSQGAERQLLQQALNQFPSAQISTFHSFIQRLLEEAPLQLRVSPQLKIDDLSYQRLFKRLVQQALLQPFSGETQRSFRARYGDKKDFDEVLARLSQEYFLKFLCGNGDVQLFPGSQERADWERVCQDFEARRGGFAALAELAQLSWSVDLFGKSKKNGGVQVLPRAGGVTRGDCAAFFSSLVECQRFSELLDCLEQRYSAAGSQGWRILPLLGSEALLQANAPELIEGWSERARVAAVDALLDALGLVREHTLGREVMEASAFLHELRARVEPRLRQQSCELGICNFDSLVDLLYQRLCGAEVDPTLRAWLRKRYRVALIDEFQDTDRRQWDIIRAIFHDGPETKAQPPDRVEEGHNAIVVGDPKQSIYGFRGVNHHTYSRALGQMDARYRLDTNYRSGDKLISCCNFLFGKLWQEGDGQGLEPFQAVRGSGKHNRRLCHLAEIEPPFTWLDCGAGVEGKQSLDELRSQVFLAIRSQIARLLSGEYHWRDDELIGQMSGKYHGDAPAAAPAEFAEPKVKPADIAVLLDQNKHCQQLRQLLAEWGIPATISMQESVFTTLEAELLGLWLQLLLDPQPQGPLRLLLLSPLWGLSPEQLTFFEESLLQDLASRQCFTWRKMLDGGQLSQVIEQFCTWGSGLTRALHQEAPDYLRQQLQQDVRHRLLLLPGGERRFADLAQLFEWLQQQQFQHRYDAVALTRVLQQAREGGISEDEQQQRLELDYHTVKLLTGHAAKGLEFPVVFVALGFKGSRRRQHDSLYLYHREQEQVIDLSASPVAQEKEQLEQSAEFRRLFYVGLTRAQFKLYLPYSLAPSGAHVHLSLLCDIFPPAEDKGNNWPPGWQPGHGRFYHELGGEVDDKLHSHLAQSLEQLCSSDADLFQLQRVELPLHPPGSQPPESQPPESQPPESQPPESQPPESQPPESQLPESQPPESQPPESQPPESQPPESQPPESQPPESQPPESQPPESQPPESQPPESQPPESQPPESQPPESQPPESQPPESQPPESQPPESQPPESQPPESQPPESQPPESQPPESQPPESQPPESQPPESQPPESQPPESQPPESQPPESQPPESQPPLADWAPARCFSRNIAEEPQPGSSSFTSLTRGNICEFLSPRDDEEGEDLLLEPPPAEVEYDRRSLSGGAPLGILLHALFEQIDFAAAQCSLADFCQSPQLLELLQRETRLSFNAPWLERAKKVLLELLWHTLQAPLPPHGLRLCQLEPRQRQHELRFLLHITQPHCPLVLNDFRADLRPGVLDGAIDLLFRWQGKIYLLDWKSNHGLVDADGQEDWSPQALEQLMAQHHYPLQYHLYLAALWRKIGGDEQRYQQEFGGCYYLFLRGLDVNKPGQGVFFHRPDWQHLLKFAAPFGLSAS